MRRPNAALLLALVLSSVSLSVPSGAEAQTTTTRPASMSARSSIEARWNEARSIWTNPMGGAGDAYEALRRALVAAPDDCDAEYARLLALDGPVAEGYDYALVQELVRLLASRTDEQRLVPLLARHCPRYLGYIETEWWLAKSPLSDPVSVLARAYRDATNPQAKRHCLEALGAAFPSLRRSVKDDDAFVQAAQDYFAAEKNKLKVNKDYVYDTAAIVRGERRHCELYISAVDTAATTRSASKPSGE
jgi:hypothetical protein